MKSFPHTWRLREVNNIGMSKQKTVPFERIPRNVSVRMRRVFIVVITEKGLKELRAQQAANRAKQHKGVEEEMASLNT